MWNEIYNEDCWHTLDRMPDNSLDLIVTSPPYNVNLGNNKYHKNPYKLYNDNKDHKEFIKYLTLRFKKCYQKLKKGGRIVINVGNGKNGAVPTNSDIIQQLIGIGYIPYTQIIWNKNQTSSRTAWGSWLSPSSPSFPTPFEFITVFCKETPKLQWKGESDLTREEFIQWSLALWTFAPEKKQKEYDHHAMFPMELPIRCIKMFSYIGATVYDPFAGAGTTLVAAKNLNRIYIGSEISEKDCKTIKFRLENE